MRKAIWLSLLFPVLIFAQSEQKPDAKKTDVWEPMRHFVGKWEGSSKGQPGEGAVEREYGFILNGKYLQVKNKSVYKPQEKNPKGEVHEDLGLISFDRGRKHFVFRQFHIEGFVNQYAAEAPGAESKTIVFTSESIENIPAGWRARETYKITNADEFVEIFELAAPGKEFEVYSECRLKRRTK